MINSRNTTDEEFLRQLQKHDKSLAETFTSTDLERQTYKELVDALVLTFDPDAFLKAHGERAICVLRGMSELMGSAVDMELGTSAMIQLNMHILAYARPLIALLPPIDVDA